MFDSPHAEPRVVGEEIEEVLQENSRGKATVVVPCLPEIRLELLGRQGAQALGDRCREHVGGKIGIMLPARGEFLGIKYPADSVGVEVPFRKIAMGDCPEVCGSDFAQLGMSKPGIGRHSLEI